MRQRTLPIRLAAVLVIVALQGLGLPTALAGTTGARVAGSILAAGDQSPVADARLHLGDPKSGKVFSSDPTSADGSFVVSDLPPATYEVAVESDGGLYLVQTPIELGAGESQDLQIAVTPLAPGQLAPSPEEAEENQKKGGTGVWNNPVTAALIVVGAAIVLGFLIKEATKNDETVSSPS